MMRNTLDAIWGGPAQQAIYRELLTAMSRPGTVVDLSDTVENRSALVGVLATVVDGEVGLADPDGLVAETDWPLLEARRDEVSDANFVVVDGSLPPQDAFDPSLGTLSNPEQGATVLIVVGSLGDGELQLGFSGPGVDGTSELCVGDLNLDWLIRREPWVESFPMGVDVVLCSATCVAAIPRSTRVSWKVG